MDQSVNVAIVEMARVNSIITTFAAWRKRELAK